MSDVSVRIVLKDEASAKFTKMNNAAKKAETAFTSVGRTLDKAFSSNAATGFASKTEQALRSVETEVQSMAGKVENSVSGLEDSLNLDVGVDDTATGVLGDIEDRASALDGTSAEVAVAADDEATQAVAAAADEVDNFDGASATGELEADDNATPEVEKAKEQLDDFDGSSGTSTTENNDNATPSIKGAKEQGEDFDGSVWTATVSIVDAATAPITSIANALKNPLAQAGTMLGIGIGLNDVVDTYSDFEATMSQVKALADASSQEMVTLTDKAKEMGAVTKYSGTESAEAFTYMAQAGWNVNSMVEGIGGVMSLAASDGIGLAEATDIVANALTAFGLEAGDSAHFADVLAQAGAASNTNVSEMGEAFKYVSPVAGTLGYSIEDISLALGVMSNNGIKASQAGTTLRSALSNLSSPTDKQLEAMEKYGISLTDSEGNMKSFRDVMDNVRSSLGGLSETEQAAAATTMFGDTAMSGMLAIVNSSQEAYDQLADSIDNSEGAADRMAETMQDNMAGALEQLGGSVETVELSWGERLEPYITDIANALSDAMPMIEEIGLKAFDVLDTKFAQVKSRISAMTSSGEWKDADLFGKIDIAWDELIAEPFTEWIGGEGKHMISEALTSLFSEAGKILPGGEEAGLTSWLSAGLLAKGATSLVSKAGNVASTLAPIGSAIKEIGIAASTATSVGAFVSNIGAMVPAAAKFGIAAAAVTAAIVGIGVAVDQYEQKQIDASLEAHFGDIEMDAEQVEDFASQVIDAEWLVNINAAIGHFENAEEFIAEAEEALDANDALEWKARVGISLTEDDQSSYADNINTFVSDIEQSLSEQTLAAKVVVDEFDIKMADGTSLGSQIQEWASQDMQEVSSLSEGLTNLVENALTDGIIDVDEQAAIDELQSKISNIMSGWQEAEAQAEMDILTQKYGRLSGADLTEDTFKQVVEELGNQRETATEALEESEKSLYTTLNALNRKDENGVQRISDSELEDYKQQAGYAVRNSEASTLANSLDFEGNTVSDAYKEKLDENYESMESSTADFFSRANAMVQEQDYGSLQGALNYGNLHSITQTSFLSDEDQKALSSIYETMQPDVESMTNLIDEYREIGQAIPEDVMESFNEAVEIGAAAGDSEAAWQLLANQMVADPANDALVEAIQDGMVDVPESLQTALSRATAETTTDPVTIEGMQADLEDVEVSQEHVDELINDAMDQTFEGLEATGNTVSLDGGEVAVEYEVTSAQTPEELANQVGITVEELLSSNSGMEEQETIEKGAKVYIPSSSVEVDTSEVSEAVDEAVQSEAGEETTVSKTVNTETQAGTVDESGAESAGEEAEAAAKSAAGGEVTTTTTVNTTYEQGSKDTSQVAAATEDIESRTVDSTATVNTETQAGTDNTATTASAFATKFQSALTTAFNKTFTATANASITVNYSIANPSKTITFSGGGSGTATVYAHAEGGIFDTPHYGVFAEAGPEAYIPIDGSENAKNIWMETGERLGMMDDGPIQVSPAGTAGGNGSTSSDGSGKATASNRSIDININGSGKITAGGGLSKDDIVNIMLEKVKDVFVQIVEEEALVGGDASYEF